MTREPKRPPPARTKEDKAFRDLLGNLVRVPKEEVDEKRGEFRKDREMDRAQRKKR